MEILGLIPARYDSSRFPGKPLADINGKSMIRCVYEQAFKARYLAGLYVVTDDKRIEKHVEESGGRAIMTSPEHLSGTDRCAEAAKLIEGKWDAIINIQGDEPFIDPQQIDQVAKLLGEEGVEIATLAKEITDERELDDPNVVKVVLDKHNHALNFRRSPIAEGKKHIGIYGYQAQVLQDITKLPQSEGEKTERLEQLRWLENCYQVRVGITTLESDSVDTPEDLQRLLNR